MAELKIQRAAERIGSQHDDNGVYKAGDLVISEPGSSHAIASDEGCVVLAIWERLVEIVE